MLHFLYSEMQARITGYQGCFKCISYWLPRLYRVTGRLHLDGTKIVHRRAGIAAADVRWDASFVHVRKRARSLFGSYLGLGLSW